MDITRWSIPKSVWLYSLKPKTEKLYKVSKSKTRSWLWLRSWTLIVKFRLKSKKIGKTTRSFRYDLNQIPYNYPVEGIKSDRQSAWRTIEGDSWPCTGISDQDYPQEKEMQKGKWLSEKALQIAEKRREAKGKREKERHTHLNSDF